MVALHLRRIDDLSNRIAEAMEPFRPARELLVGIPGFSTTTAEVIIAETGADMSAFPAAGHFAAGGGTIPGAVESAGQIRSTKTRPCNACLKAALGTAAIGLRLLDSVELSLSQLLTIPN